MGGRGGDVTVIDVARGLGASDRWMSLVGAAPHCATTNAGWMWTYHTSGSVYACVCVCAWSGGRVRLGRFCAPSGAQRRSRGRVRAPRSASSLEKDPSHPVVRILSFYATRQHTRRARGATANCTSAHRTVVRQNITVHSPAGHPTSVLHAKCTTFAQHLHQKGEESAWSTRMRTYYACRHPGRAGKERFTPRPPPRAGPPRPAGPPRRPAPPAPHRPCRRTT